MMELVTLTPEQLSKKSSLQIQELATMYESYLIYKQEQENNINQRSAYTRMAKAELDKSRQSMEADDFRESNESLIQSETRKYFKEETLSFLSHLKSASDDPERN